MNARQRLIVTAACAAAAMTTIDTTVLNVALPSIKSDFNVSISTVQWLVTAYTATFAILMVPAGRIADIIGRDRVWIVGAATFALASIACGFAPSIGALIAGRVIQGAGAAAMKPTTVAMVAAAVPAERRGWALGIMGSALAGAAALGPAVGSVLTASLGWRAIFLVNPPIALAAILILRRAAEGKRPPATRERIDVLGAALIGMSLLLVIVALTHGDDFGSEVTAGVVAAAVASGAAFVLLELRRDTPILELHLFRRAQFVAANAITFLTSVGFFAAYFLQSLYLQAVAGVSILASGLLVVPLGLATLVSSTIGGRLSDRLGVRVPIVAGLGLCITGLVLLTRLKAGDSYAAHVLPAYLLEGAGWGLASAPLNAAVISAAGIERSGQAAGVQSTLDKFGAAFGVALASSLFDSRGEGSLGSELGKVGVHAGHRLGELESILGAPDMHAQTRLIVHAHPAAAQLALDRAFMLGFETVMAVSAAVFGLALIAAFALPARRAEPAARRPIIPRRTAHAHHRPLGRLEG